MKEKVHGHRETIGLLGREIHSNERRQRGNPWKRSQDSCAICGRSYGNQKAFSFSLHLHHMLSQLCFLCMSAPFTLRVSGHLIAIYTPHHLSRKEGFSIWMQEYSMELRVRKCSQLLQETGAKDYKSHPELKRSFYFLQVRMSLVSVTVLLPFSCLPPSLSILLPWHLPTWALFQHSCSQTSVLPLYHFLSQVPNGDLWVIEWQFHISREVSDWPRLGQLTTWWLS